MLDPKRTRRYEVKTETGDFTPVHWEQLEKGDVVRQYDPDSIEFLEYTLFEQPCIRVATEEDSKIVYSAPTLEDPELQKAANSLCLWWTMVACEAELCNETIEDTAIALHYSGCGASHMVTAGEIRRLTTWLSLLKAPTDSNKGGQNAQS